MTLIPPLLQPQEQRETMVSQLFREIVVHDSARIPWTEYVWDSEKHEVTLRNDSSHLVFFGFQYADPVEIPPGQVAKVLLGMTDLIYPPEIRYPQAEFLEAKFSLVEFQQFSKGVYTFPLDFSNFTFIQLDRDEEGDLELTLRCEKEAGKLICPKKTTFLLEKKIGCFPFERNYNPTPSTEDYNIHVVFKNGTEEFYGRFFAEDPQSIEKIRIHVKDRRVSRRIVLLAKS